MGWYKRWSEELVRSDVWNNPDLRHFWSDLLDLGGCDPGDGKIKDLLTQLPLTANTIQNILKLSQIKYAELFAILEERGMVKIDAGGFVTICKWEHYQNHYKRQYPYRRGKAKVTTKVTNKVTGETDESYILYLMSLYKVKREYIEREFIKMRAWLDNNPGRQFTRRFVTSWLNKNIGDHEVQFVGQKKPPSKSCTSCGDKATMQVRGKDYCTPCGIMEKEKEGIK